MGVLPGEGCIRGPWAPTRALHTHPPLPVRYALRVYLCICGTSYRKRGDYPCVSLGGERARHCTARTCPIRLELHALGVGQGGEGILAVDLLALCSMRTPTCEVHRGCVQWGSCREGCLHAHAPPSSCKIRRRYTVWILQGGVSNNERCTAESRNDLADPPQSRTNSSQNRCERTWAATAAPTPAARGGGRITPEANPRH